VKGRGLRVFLYGAGAAFLAGAGLFLVAGCGLAAALRLAVPGFIMIAALAFERWRYRRIGALPPDPGWVATGERCIDPETHKPVTVYHNADTGERRYVAR
jgi:hypothetical protein